MKRKIADEPFVKKWCDAKGRLHTELRYMPVWEDMGAGGDSFNIENELIPPPLDADRKIWGKERDI